MQTELAQLLSLTSYGNEYIRSGQIVNQYYTDGTVFQHCNCVDFRDFRKNLFSSKFEEVIVAETPPDWFRLLKKEGCLHLRLYYKATNQLSGPEYNHVGFVGGGGSWLMETNFGPFSHYWNKRWLVGNKDAPDRKIWIVNYAREIKNFSPSNQQLNIAETRNQFEATLNELINFCSEQTLQTWLEVFQKAKGMFLHAAPNTVYYHHDFNCYKNYSLAAQQLLFGAASAWVFGGMGSWNDMGFADSAVQQKYMYLSQQLYEQILQSIIAVINSF